MQSRQQDRYYLVRVASRGIAICGLCLIFAGCESRQSAAPASPDAVRETVSPLATLTGVQQQQKELAVAAKTKLFESLLAELTQSMGANGPAKSIGVCKSRAPEIAKSVGQETGVRIGRTSFQLRNPDNVAPDWAATFVQQRITDDVEVALKDDALGVLMPIRLKATCLLCHGSDEQLMPEVKTAIASNYPQDQATGFSEGDLRGYFWVEVPAGADR